MAGPHLRCAWHPAGASKPYSPEGRGKQERLNRYIREAFLAEAVHRGIESLDGLNDLFAAWAEQVANRRVHAETGQMPIGRFEAAGPPRQASPDRLREAFRWSVTRRHVHRAVPQAARPEPDPTGVDYLGLVAAAHDEEAGTGAKIDFTQLGKLPGSDPGQQEER